MIERNSAERLAVRLGLRRRVPRLYALGTPREQKLWPVPLAIRQTADRHKSQLEGTALARDDCCAWFDTARPGRQSALDSRN
jgi:hypothetical protein